MEMPLDAIEDAPDDALLVLFAKGDPLAARELTKRLLPGVLALSRRMLKNEAAAEDAAQEAMLKLWKIAPKWKPGKARVSTWLYLVTHNHCTDVLRRARSVQIPEGLDPASDAPSALEQIATKDRAVALHEAMQKLPDRQALALHLRHFDELSNIEISRVMGTTVEAVEGLLGRGKRALSQMLLEEKEALGLE